MESLCFSGRASECGIQSSEVRFLMETRNFFFVSRSWRDEKTSFLNNLVVYLKEVTGTQNRILLESYSLTPLACRARKRSYNGDLFMHSHVKHFWYKPTQTGYEWTKSGTKRPCVLNDWIPFKRVKCTVLNKCLLSKKCPPRIGFFLISSLILISVPVG